MKYEEIVELWNKDSQIDPDRLDSESLRTPMIQGTYFNLFCRERAVLSKLNIDLKKLRRWKRDYLLGEISPEELVEKGIPVPARRIVKADVDLYIDTDDEVIALLGKIVVVQTKVDFLDLCVKSLTTRGWTIRNAIEFLKFKHGVI